LRQLLDSAFGRPLRDSFFARDIDTLYLDEEYRGVAIVQNTSLGSYLNKFAVEREAQGEGLGRDIWEMLTREHPRLFWRSRRHNPIDPWYIQQCDGMMRVDHWHIFWKGFPPKLLADAIAFALAEPEDFPRT
jgi:acetylglutamate kinase